MARTYVIGHVNPDTDSIAAAVGYAWLLRERDGEEFVAARAGPTNPQTTWVLKRLGLDPPVLLTDASPRFETITRRLDTATPDSPLREAWVILNRTGGIAPIVNREDDTPNGMITGLSLFNFFVKWVGPHPKQGEMRLSDMLELPCNEACDTGVPRFQAGVHIRDVLGRILREDHNDFLIVDEKGVYQGVACQRDALNPPRLRLILVDHNEPGQALGAVEEAELIEILDHHRLGNMSTHTPIRFSVDVVGSTGTLVSERMEEVRAERAARYRRAAASRLAGGYADLDLAHDDRARSPGSRAVEPLGIRAARTAGRRNDPIVWGTSLALGRGAFQPEGGRNRLNRYQNV